MRVVVERFLAGSTPASRCLLAIGAACPFYGMFLCLHGYALQDASIRPGLDIPVMWALQGVLLLSLALLVTMALWLWPRRFSAAELPVAERVITLDIGLTYTAIAIAGGSFAAGPNLVLLGILTIGLLLFTQRAMFLAYVVCALTLLLYDGGVLLGYWPYPLAVTPMAFDEGLPRGWWELWRSAVYFVGLAVVVPLIMALFGRLDALHARLAHLSVTDALTGLSNRRCFMERLDKEVRRQSRTGRPLSVVLIDADHFKQVNDRYGHAVGDAVLQRLASTLSMGVRAPTDLAARMGGEEFALLLPETSLDDARQAAERLQQRLRAERFEAQGQAFHLTLSLGVVQALGHVTEDILREADRNLYHAKEAGRDRVILTRLPDALPTSGSAP